MHYSLTLVVCLSLLKPAFADDALIDYDNIAYPGNDQQTFNATIRKVEEREWILGSGTTTGLFLTVACSHEEFTVPIAPLWYLQNRAEFQQNLEIQITGIRRLVHGGNIIIPKMIKIGADELLLRNYDGRPFWNGTGNYGQKSGTGMQRGGKRGRGAKRRRGAF
jgi:hypothetical protein